MSPARHDLDEDDVRIRPGKNKARARSKQRPAHEDAASGLVVAVDRGRFTVAVNASSDPANLVYAVKARELGRKGIVLGDQVDLVGELTGGVDALTRIVRRHPRRTTLRRTADDTDQDERVIVANADQLAVVVAAAQPEPRSRLVDRALIAAYDGGLAPLLVVTKTDLAPAAPFVEQYLPLDLSIVTTSLNSSVDELSAMLTGKVTVLVGHSGVGKSTLVNALVPEASRSVGHVNAVTGRGRHTSTSAVALPLTEGGWVVDTPGIRSFGLAHVDVDRFLQAFPDLAAGAVDCPRGCTHDDEHCALDAFVAAGGADPARLLSLRRLLASRAGGDEPIDG
jgi:ribosome biogenesis GTPase / thiamine phosphate phosphatase